MTAASKNELTIVRILNASREKVWRACLHPDALKEWWGLPNGATMPFCNVDFRVGGSMHCEIRTPDGSVLWFKWTYRDIVERERLVMEQHLSDENGNELDSPARPASTITLRLEDANGKTKLTITHAGMASELYPVDLFEQGWSQSLGRLADSLSRP